MKGSRFDDTYEEQPKASKATSKFHKCCTWQCLRPARAPGSRNNGEGGNQPSDDPGEHTSFTACKICQTLYRAVQNRGLALVFSSWSLVAAPCHQKPRAVWILGARPSANTAPDYVCEQTLQKHIRFGLTESAETPVSKPDNFAETL